jgi:hypothetical protein
MAFLLDFGKNTFCENKFGCVQKTEKLVLVRTEKFETLGREANMYMKIRKDWVNNEITYVGITREQK